MNSALYTGTIRHRRYSPRPHAFRYSSALFYLDLAETDRLFRVPLFFSKACGVLQFRRSDYLGDPAQPLDSCVRELVETRTGRKLSGPIRLLTQLRYMGFCFNPVSFYYCFSTSGALEAIVSEITNTPWNERHAYVNLCTDAKGVQCFEFDKDFHVSPFMPMEQRYAWKFQPPSSACSVHMENWSPDGKTLLFDATLTLKRKHLTAASVAVTVLQFPLLTIKAALAIYYQALRLWLKGIPFHPHPKGETT